MSTSATLRGWRPRTPVSYARPVQDESATAGLSGAELPNGTGILLWALGELVRWAIVSSPSQFVVDDVVPSADMHTALTISGGTIEGTKVFVANGGLYFLIEYRQTDVGYVRLYEADDPNTPTSWSLKSTLMSADTSSTNIFGTNRGCGAPLVLDSGRWVLSSPRYSTEGLTFWRGMNVGAWYSDDDGATWTSTLNYQHVYFFTRADIQSHNVARDPITGDLFFTSSSSTSFVDVQTALWRSQDDGESWVLEDGDGGNYGTAPRLSGFVDNGQHLYLMEGDLAAGGSVDWGIYEYDGAGATFSDFVFTDEHWPAPSVTPDEPTMLGVVTRRGVYFFTLDMVMFVPGGGWHTGFTGT